MHTRAPSGIHAQSLLPHAPYKDVAGAHVFAWRPGHWYTWMFEVSKMGPKAPDVPASGWTISKDTNAIFGLASAPKANNSQVQFLGEFETLEGCWGACNATEGCTEFAWHETTFDPSWAKQCYQAISGKAPLAVDKRVTSGLGPQPARKGEASFLFGAGGNQGGEGNDGAGEWYIENVLEELDAKNEWPPTRTFLSCPRTNPSDVVRLFG